MPYNDISTGFTGFTVDVLNGSTSDSEGDVSRVLFAITFPKRQTDVQFSISSAVGDWSALMPTDEYIGLRNPKVLQTNRDSAIVQFDMDEKYPSNHVATLCARSASADFNIVALDTDIEFFNHEIPEIGPGMITGAIGNTVFNFVGNSTTDGEVDCIIFNFVFNRQTEIEFKITEEDDDWAALMPDGSLINLKNPYILFQNKDGASVSFQMASLYPAGSPGFLVRRRKEANWVVESFDEEQPFLPVQSIVLPDYIPVGEAINLHSQVLVYPLNASRRSVTWSIANPGTTGATVANGWITAKNPGKVTLHAFIENGNAIGEDWETDYEIQAIKNWIEIKEQPHLENALVAGNITESIYVLADTPSGSLTYQWYKAPRNSNEEGSAISGATASTYKLPKGLLPGEYFYFCEIRKVNFPSIRTECAHIRVRDNLRSISIYPSSASIPPGSQQQFSIDRNPQTSDESRPVNWYSDKPWIISIDSNGLATAHSRGSCTIKADVDGVTDRIIVQGIYTPVDGITDTLPDVLDAKTEYTLPTAVTPSNATKRTIVWEIIDSGTTGATISNGKLRALNPGNVSFRATIPGGLNYNTDFVREYAKSVVQGHVPVIDVILKSSSTPRVGDVIALNGSCVPVDASATGITWSIADAGSTGASITSGNLLVAQRSGPMTITATVENGKAVGSRFVKNFTLNFQPKFISVDHIEGIPVEIGFNHGQEGYPLQGIAMPETAAHRNIIYKIDENNEMNKAAGLSPRIVDNMLVFDAAGMTHEDQKSIVVDMYIRDGISDGVDYFTQTAIYITPPLPDSVFTPVDHVIWKMPSRLRAYRPILIDKSTVNPFNAYGKYLIWEAGPAQEIGGSAAIMFAHTEENHQDLVSNGVLFDSQYDWDFRGNTIYPMSAGKLKIKVTVPDGLAIDTDYVEERIVDVEDPFIKIVKFTNMPSTVYAGSKFYLSPEIDTGDGVNEQTAVWDDRVPTYGEIKYELIAGGDIAELSQDGILTLKKSGQVRVRLTVENGLCEEYEWYDKQFDSVSAVQTFVINVEKAPSKPKNRIMALKLTNGRTVSIYTKPEFDMLRAIRPANSTMKIGDITFARQDVAEVTFESSFKYTDLSNFGRNMTNLVKINKIPDSARSLRNFLMGCSKFNQAITIPKTITGNNCLEGFLRDCVSFNQPIVIPDVSGTKCLESFLRGCKKFNRAIKLPTELRGNYAMYYFMQGCVEFNSQITLPKKVYGTRCMESVLRDCVKFNQQITMPEDISGHYNVAAFMFNCNAFTKPVIIPTERFAEKAHDDVITFSTFYRDSAMAKHGIDLYGEGAEIFQELVPNQGSATRVPLRTLNLNGVVAPEPEVPEGDGYVAMSVQNEVEYNEGSDGFAVNDHVGLKVNVTNYSERLKTTGIQVQVPIPSNLFVTGVSTTKDLQLIQEFEGGGVENKNLLAPAAPSHEHNFTGEYFYDADGHWQKCSGCEVLSGKEEHIPDGEATDTKPSVCSVCGYVIEHAKDGTGVGNPECAHEVTELRGVIDPTTETDGYSGDVYCCDCNRLIAVGHVVPKLSDAASVDDEIAAQTDGVAAQNDDTVDDITGGSFTTKLTFRISEMEANENVEFTIRAIAHNSGDTSVTSTLTFDQAGQQESADSNSSTVDFAIAEGGTPEETPEGDETTEQKPSEE